MDNFQGTENEEGRWLNCVSDLVLSDYAATSDVGRSSKQLRFIYQGNIKMVKCYEAMLIKTVTESYSTLDHLHLPPEQLIKVVLTYNTTKRFL